MAHSFPLPLQLPISLHYLPSSSPSSSSALPSPYLLISFETQRGRSMIWNEMEGVVRPKSILEEIWKGAIRMARNKKKRKEKKKKPLVVIVRCMKKEAEWSP
ncbi:hypothetical protein IE53DRAFT_69805 [Violaceomyces palustris]|uniref:Uncharacterized protein n=1 Tax=Violaceomyces palustris TaxID=1673888 RepID=A0ACD0P8T6_9BASI|nr:hypothetical protein IE53DRAFT_69805 [Violaceomyces palustris]